MSTECLDRRDSGVKISDTILRGHTRKGSHPERPTPQEDYIPGHHIRKNHILKGVARKKITISGHPYLKGTLFYKTLSSQGPHLGLLSESR